MIDLCKIKEDFSVLVKEAQPWTLTQFVMWLDLKLSEFKVKGYMVLDHQSMTRPQWIIVDDPPGDVTPVPAPCRKCCKKSKGTSRSKDVHISCVNRAGTDKVTQSRSKNDTKQLDNDSVHDGVVVFDQSNIEMNRKEMIEISENCNIETDKEGTESDIAFQQSSPVKDITKQSLCPTCLSKHTNQGEIGDGGTRTSDTKSFLLQNTTEKEITSLLSISLPPLTTTNILSSICAKEISTAESNASSNERCLPEQLLNRQSSPSTSFRVTTPSKNQTISQENLSQINTIESYFPPMSSNTTTDMPVPVAMHVNIDCVQEDQEETINNISTETTEVDIKVESRDAEKIHEDLCMDSNQQDSIQDQQVVESVVSNLNLTSVTGKRKRNDLSLSDKFKVIKLLDEGKTQREISKLVNASQSQISRVKLNRGQIQKVLDTNYNIKRRRVSFGKDAEVDQALFGWYKEAKEKEYPISRQILTVKAKELATSLGKPEFEPTPGWLERWRVRNCVTYTKEKK